MSTVGLLKQPVQCGTMSLSLRWRWNVLHSLALVLYSTERNICLTVVSYSRNRTTFAKCWQDMELNNEHAKNFLNLMLTQQHQRNNSVCWKRKTLLHQVNCLSVSLKYNNYDHFQSLFNRTFSTLTPGNFCKLSKQPCQSTKDWSKYNENIRDI